MVNVKEIGKDLIKKINDVRPPADDRACGKIISSGDGIIHISGLHGVKYNELLEIRGGYRALALNLEHDSVGAVLFSGEDLPLL